MIIDWFLNPVEMKITYGLKQKKEAFDGLFYEPVWP